MSPVSRAIVVVGKATLGAPVLVRGAGRSIALQASSDGSAWMTLTTALMDVFGSATFSVAPTVPMRYRAVFAGVLDLAHGTSALATITVAQRVSLWPTPQATFRAIRRGALTTFTGTARPKPSASTILTFQIYRRVAGIWKLSATRRVSSDIAGAAKLSWRFGTSGDWEVRVRAEATTVNSASAWTSFVRYRVT